MALDIVRLLGGGVLLYFGAEWLVGGAAGLARAMRVSSLLIGLTVVAYGTSTPEVIVGIEAAVSGRGDIALGNVIGSNIANLGLILGACTLVRPAKVEGALVRREIPVLVVTALLVPLLLLGAAVHRWEGALLVVAATVTRGSWCAARAGPRHRPTRRRTLRSPSRLPSRPVRRRSPARPASHASAPSRSPGSWP